MRIMYRLMARGLHAFDMDPADTVAMLKAKIGQHESVDPSSFYLIFGGDRLEKERTLASYNFRRTDIVTMAFRMCGNGHTAVPDTGVLFPIKIRVPGAGYSRVIDALGSIPFQQHDFEVILSRPCVGKVVLRKEDSDEAGFTPSAPAATLTVILPGFPPREMTSTNTFDPLSGTSADEVIENLRTAVSPCVPAELRRRGFDVFLTRPSGAQVLLDGAAVLASPHNATTTVHVRPKEPEEALGRSATPVNARMQLYYRRSTNELRALEVEACDTVAMVMGEIGKREGVDPSSFYLVGNGSVLEEKRTLASYNIQKHSTVTMAFRLLGGGTMLDHEALLQVLGADVAAAIATLRVLPNETCVCCTEDGPCVVFCHTKLCVAECAEAQLRAAKMQFKCYICREVKGADDLFPQHPTMLQYGRTLKDVKQLTRNCDVQVCECGVMNVNETMFARQQCPMCRRVACFFCNRKWCAEADGGQKAMVNRRFYCNDDCALKVKLTFELVQFHYDDAGVLKVPMLRVCPVCFEAGGYDSKCKYHECTCGHKLCFLCLRSEAECKALGSNYKAPCKSNSSIPEQSFDMFPRLISPPK